MTARSTFFANATDLPAIQVEVKRHNMRFVGNPAAWVDKLARMSVTVEAEDMSDFNAGVAAIDTITNPYIPKETSKLRIGFKGKNQLPWVLIWREYWRGDEVVFARVLFKF